MVWEQYVTYWTPSGEVYEHFFFPLHWSVVDRTGGAIVIEYTEDGRKIFENEVGVMTNSPTYDWHQTNLNNYINIQNRGFPAKHYTRHNENFTVKPVSLGTGFLGLPGDFTSPSRFIRTAAMVRFSGDARDAKKGVLKALHILNSVDITQGNLLEHWISKFIKYSGFITMNNRINLITESVYIQCFNVDRSTNLHSSVDSIKR